MSLLLGLLTACEYAHDGWIFQPYQGPGYELGEGLLFEPEEGETFIAATTYFPVSKDGQAVFDDDMDTIQASLDTEPEGLIAYSLAQKMVGREYRTLTTWRSEDAMMQWVTGEAHVQAMSHAADIEDPERQALVVRWEVAPEDLPLDWDAAIERLDDAGRGLGE